MSSEEKVGGVAGAELLLNSGQPPASGKYRETSASGNGGEAPGKDEETSAPEDKALGREGTSGQSSGESVRLKVYLRDISKAMVTAWEDKEAFGSDTFKELVEVS